MLVVAVTVLPTSEVNLAALHKPFVSQRFQGGGKEATRGENFVISGGL